jgi:protein-tyrosine phosphatase
VESADDVRDEVFRVITVCTHNRTRSVMSMAMIQAGLDSRLGEGWAVVESLGIGPDGRPPITEAVGAMRRRGLDVAGHRSRRLTAERLAGADLVLVSEKRHVASVAGPAPELFAATFTLPEFCELSDVCKRSRGTTLTAWLGQLGAGRNAAAYLRADIPEVVDPTGLSRRRFEAATLGIETMCAAAVEALAVTR